MNNLNFKKGDQVKVLAGRDKGKTGKVLGVDLKHGKLTVEGINLITRHQRPRKTRQKGQKVIMPAPMSPAKVMLICPQCDRPTRVGHQILESGKKLRRCRKCGGTFN
jgi:large subunit ribosomal protein L24